MSDPYPSYSEDLRTFNESLENLDEGIRDFMWKRHRTRSVLVFSVSIGLMLLFAGIEFMFFDWRHATEDQFKGAVTLPLLPLIPLIIYIATIRARVTEVFKRQLAEAIGFTYGGEAPMGSVSGHIFEFGNARYLSDVYIGKFGVFPGRFYTYTFVKGSGKHARYYSFTVGEIDYGRTLPHLLLRPENNRLETDWRFPESEALTPEGGFSDRFDYYAEKGKRIEALQVLEPTIMALFHDEFPDFGFETFGTKLYVFCPLYGIRTKQGFIGLHKLLLTLGSRIVPELYNVSAEQDPVYT